MVVVRGLAALFILELQASNEVDPDRAAIRATSAEKGRPPGSTSQLLHLAQDPLMIYGTDHSNGAQVKTARGRCAGDAAPAASTSREKSA